MGRSDSIQNGGCLASLNSCYVGFLGLQAGVGRFFIVRRFTIELLSCLKLFIIGKISLFFLVVGLNRGDGDKNFFFFFFIVIPSSVCGRGNRVYVVESNCKRSKFRLFVTLPLSPNWCRIDVFYDSD